MYKLIKNYYGTTVFQSLYPDVFQLLIRLFWTERLEEGWSWGERKNADKEEDGQ